MMMKNSDDEDGELCLKTGETNLKYKFIIHESLNSW